MTEHPPIPYGAIEAACHAWLDARQPLAADRVRSIVAAVAPVLWEEWTRGMAVVPLPAADATGLSDGDRWDPFGPGSEVWAFVGEVSGVPAVATTDGCENWSPDQARSFAASLLAAADRAEQLVAEAVNTNG